MRRLVALDLPGGPGFVTALRAAWDAGDAVLPVDQRLPGPARDRLLTRARPHRVVTGDGADDVEVLDDAAPLVEDGDALVIASSGTTGEPKLIVHTFDALGAHASAVHAHLGVTASDRWLACLPLAHIGGLGVVVRSLLTGTPFDVIDGFDAATVAAAPDRLGATLVSLVPLALDRLDDLGAANRFGWIVLGGDGDQVERPGNVVHTYGSTETGGGVVYGQHRLAGLEIKMDDVGALAVRGPYLARGRRRPDGSVEPVTDADGWLWTGDLGRRVQNPAAPDGWHLAVDGRANDLIVTGGQNVWPMAVENRLRTHPAVAEVAVYGVADHEWGQRVTAAIVVAPGAAPPSLDDLRDHVRADLPAYTAPTRLVVLDALPRTALGKVRRNAIEPD
jgi:O-succinylbenzoic acid--CoA ligase